MRIFNISLLLLSQEEIITSCEFENGDFILPTHGLEYSVIENLVDSCLNSFDPESMDSISNFVPDNSF